MPKANYDTPRYEPLQPVRVTKNNSIHDIRTSVNAKEKIIMNHLSPNYMQMKNKNNVKFQAKRKPSIFDMQKYD